MSRKLIKLALVAGVTLVAACDDNDNVRDDGETDAVTRGLQDLGGSALVQAFQADANDDPINAQTISIEPQPRAEPFDPN